MRFIGYEEQYPGQGYPKMSEALRDRNHPHKKEIIRFLTNGAIIGVRLSRVKDIFSGTQIPMEAMVMSDGEFSWSNTLAWYVEKYNLRLPEDFEQHILRKAGIK